MLSINAVVLVLAFPGCGDTLPHPGQSFPENIEILTDAVGSIQKDNLYLDISIHSGDEAEVLYHRFEGYDPAVSRNKSQI